MVFEKLIDFILQFWNRILPVEVVRHYEVGAVLRFGVYNRTMEPGIHAKWPIVEEVIVQNAVITTVRLPPQSLTTTDDVGVVVAAIVKYKISSIEKYVTQIWDAHDVLIDVTLGAIRTAVSSMSWPELKTQLPEERVIELVRKEVNQYGFRVLAITFTDLGRVRSLRLIQQVAKDIDN